VVVGAVEQGEPAVVKPPAGLPLLGAAGLLPIVVVLVRRGELLLVVFVHRVLGAAGVAGDVKSVLIALACQEKMSVDAVAGEVPEVDPELVAALVGQKEHVVVAQPVLASHVPEARPVGLPAAVEALEAVLAALQQKPAAVRGLHVAPHGDRAGRVQRLDVVHAATVVARAMHARTIW
ncbi:hypothetical protein EGW08_011073, partial [Elysia chlorotica]